MPEVDLDILTGAMAEFESGEDMPSNPFAQFPDRLVANAVTGFVSGFAVPDTKMWLDRLGGDHAEAYATAGFLQGLAVGYDYAKREQ